MSDGGHDAAPGRGGPHDEPDDLRWRIRTLDPRTAPRRAGGRVPSPTAYIADRVLVAGSPSRAAREVSSVAEVAKSLGWAVEPEKVDRHDEERVAKARLGAADATTVEDASVTGLRIVPRDGVGEPPDAWRLVEALGDARVAGGRVGLDHVVVATPARIGGNPYTSPHPYTSP